MGLIHKVVSTRMKGYYQDHDDVVNMAAVKFFKAIDSFEFDKGAKFSTYLCFWIDAAIYDFWHSKNVVHIPRNIDLAEGTVGNLATNSRLVWLDKALPGSNGDSTFGDVVASRFSVMPDVEVSQILENDKLMDVVDNQLDRAERLVIKYRYLKDIPAPLEHLSKMLTITETKLETVERVALMKLRRLLKGMPAPYHVKFKKELPSDEKIEESYQVYLKQREPRL